MSQAIQDRGGFGHHDQRAESVFDVVRTNGVVPDVQDSPRSDATSSSESGELSFVQSSFSTRRLSPRKTYLLDDIEVQLHLRPTIDALAESTQSDQYFKDTKRVISASPERNYNTWNAGSIHPSTDDCNGEIAVLSLPQDSSNTVKRLACPPTSRTGFLMKETADIKDYTTTHDRKQLDLTLGSPSGNDVSGATPYRSFHLVNVSSNNLSVKTVPSVYVTSNTGTGYFATDAGNYASLQHRRSPGSTTRRTSSAESRHQSFKSDLVKTPIYRELTSEFIALNPRQNSECYTEMSKLKQAYDSEYYSAEKLDFYRNGSSIQNDDVYSSALPNSDSNEKNGVLFSSHATLNKSLLNTNTETSSKEQTARKTDVQSIDPKTTDALRSLLSNGHPPDEIGNSNITVFDVNEIESIGISKNQRDSEGDTIEASKSLPRSHSLTDLQAREIGVRDTLNYSDDEDGDHFGFLSYPVSFLPSCTSAAMNKVKSPTSGKRIFTKRWRSKTNVLPSVSTPVAMWTPGPAGSCRWSSVSGRKVQLRPASILSLTEAERLALQKVALVRLQNLELGCPVVVPKEMAELPRVKKSPLSLKKRSKSVSASALDTMAKEGTAVGLVFGIPLLRCVLNDRELESRRRQIAAAVPAAPPAPLQATSDSSDNLLVFGSARKSSSSSQGSAENGSLVFSQRLDSLTVSAYRRTASSGSLSVSEYSQTTNSSLIDALALPTTHPAARPGSLPVDGSHLANQGICQVPYVVKACFKHIQTYGLQTLGIFRVGCSKKRVNQLREEFDCGRTVDLTEEHNPHDVGALLKEYFRDLPEPLLTNELYLPFLYAERLKDENRRHSAISLLISILPIANRDTLWALLRFLAVVSQHAPDSVDGHGEIISGNKMDSHNLATLFGPNILRRTRGTSDKELMSESAERVEQSKEVIGVVKDMIDNHLELFEISESLRDEVLRLLVKSNQEAVDKILRCLASQNQIETDPESMGSVFEESSSIPTLSHCVNSDADLLAFVRKQTAASHRPLRITRSADDSLDSPLSNYLHPDSAVLQSMSFVSRDIHKTVPPNLASQPQQKFSSNHTNASPVSNRIPLLKLPCEQANSEVVVLRNRLETSHFDRPCSEGYNQSLNIPRPQYLRENSTSSTSSAASSSRNSYGGTENIQMGQQILQTPPRSRAASPKQLSRTASPKQLSRTASPSSSPSALIASPANSQFIQPRSHSASCENHPPIGSAEWEKERWKYWERLATRKKTSEAEQETLV